MTTLLKGLGCLFILISSHPLFAAAFAPEDGAPGDQFGYAVALNGTIALVGAPYDDDNFSDGGTLYVIENVAGVWTQKEKIYASDAQAGGQFGRSIVLSQSRNSAIVDSKYYFTDDGNGNWSEQAVSVLPTLTNSNTVFLDDLLIVGDNSNNAVNVYNLVNNTWVVNATLQSDDISTGDRFGEALAFDGEYLVVGAPGDYFTSINAGSVYVFQYNAGSWTQIQKMWGDDRASNRYFGNEVVLFDNHVAIGRNSGFELFSHPREGWLLEQAPMSQLRDDSTTNNPYRGGPYPVFNALRGPYTATSPYNNYKQRFSTGSTGGREMSNLQNNTLSFFSNTERSYTVCLRFTSIQNGSLQIDGVHNNNDSYSSCNHSTAKNEYMNDYDIDATQLIRGYKSKNIWGSNSGSVYFDDITASLPENGSTANDSVVSGDLTGSTKQGGDINGSISATDPNGLTDGSYFTISAAPAYGNAFINAQSGVWFFFADDQFYGDDSFVVTVTDDLGNTTEQPITITVTGLTITGDTSISTDINTNTNGDLNAADAEGISNLLYTITTPAANGAASIDGLSGNWSYQPNTDFIGSDSFMVTIDGNGYGQQLISILVQYPDTDSDGTRDDVDNCIATANADQLDTDGDLIGNACDPDSDNDTIDDVADNCPLLENADQLDLDNDQIGDICDNDVDGDLAPNNTDNCPLVFNETQDDYDSDSLGNECDPDADGDTVLDVIELKFDGDPLDASDVETVLGAIAAYDPALLNNKNVPAMGGLGLVFLGLSMIGLAATRPRKTKA